MSDIQVPNSSKKPRAKRIINPNTKKSKWCYKPAEVKTIFGKNTPKLILVDKSTGITWAYFPAAWDERVVKFDDESLCWKWRGSYHRQGMGIFHVHRYNDDKRKSGQMSIQRISMAIHLDRPLTEDEWVMNTCHNPECCNPNHLKIGTKKETYVNSEGTRLKYYYESKYSQEWLEENKLYLWTSSPKEISVKLGMTYNQAQYLKTLCKNRTSNSSNGSKVEVIDLRNRSKN